MSKPKKVFIKALRQIDSNQIRSNYYQNQFKTIYLVRKATGICPCQISNKVVVTIFVLFHFHLCIHLFTWPILCLSVNKLWKDFFFKSHVSSFYMQGQTDPEWICVEIFLYCDNWIYEKFFFATWNCCKCLSTILLFFFLFFNKNIVSFNVINGFNSICID